MTNNLRSTVIVQDRLNTYGGGERVINELLDTIPGEVDIITGDYDPSSTYDFSRCNVVELKQNTFLSFIKSRLTMDWSDYDLAILSGNRPQFIQCLELPIPTIRYCHSPTRTFWSLRDRDFRNAGLQGKLARTIIAPVYRSLDAFLNKRHNKIIANSHNTRSQVDRFYGLEASVAYPPVDTDDFEYSPHNGYWLSVNRLVPKKRIDLQIDTFKNIDEELVIIGAVDQKHSEYGQRVASQINTISNIRLEKSVSQERLVSLYSNAKGVLYTPVYEDFGIVPIEAMASGKPVVTVAEGGPVETVHDQQTGWLVAPTASEIRQQVTSDFNEEEFRSACLVRAKQFDTGRFKSKVLSEISQ